MAAGYDSSSSLELIRDQALYELMQESVGTDEEVLALEQARVMYKALPKGG